MRWSWSICVLIGLGCGGSRGGGGEASDGPGSVGDGASAEDADAGDPEGSGDGTEGGETGDDGGGEDAGDDGGEPPSGSWTQLPLRTEPQRDAGYAGGEGMQMIYGMAFAPSDASVAYLVSDTSQVWRSDDGGRSWQHRHAGFLANGGVSLAVHPSDPDVVLVAGSQMDLSTDADADGIYRTADGGESWSRVRATPIESPLEDKGGTQFAFVNDDVVIAGMQMEGLLRSEDGGASWETLGRLEDAWILDVTANPDDPETLFVATRDAGVFRYDLATDTLNALGSVPDHARAIVVEPGTPGPTLYASVGPAGVVRSVDGGETFEACGGIDGWVTYLAMTGGTAPTLLASLLLHGGPHPLASDDGCEAWREPEVMDAGDLVVLIHGEQGGEYWSSPIAPSPEDPNVALTSGAGNHIERTEDAGVAWVYSGDGYTGGRASALSWHAEDPERLLVVLTDFGAVLSVDGGDTFESIRPPTTGSGVAGAWVGDSLVVAFHDDVGGSIIVRSDDGGMGWTSTGATEGYFPVVLAHPQRPEVVYAGAQRSDDGGSHWTDLPHRILALSAEDGDTVFGVAANGAGGVVYRSEDAGAQWNPLPGTVEEAEIFALAVDAEDPNRVYAAGDAGVWVHDGVGWGLRAAAHGLEPDRFGATIVRSLATDPTTPGVVYAGRWHAFRGHANGLFGSKDGGETWISLIDELGPEFNTEYVTVRPTDGRVFLGSSHGTWHRAPLR